MIHKITRKNVFWLLRPSHWIKNGFVLVGLLFGRAFLNPEMLLSAVLAFAAFCLIASFVYVVNDLADVEADRRHPIKRYRPIASGTVSAFHAKSAAAVLLAGALPLAWLASPLVLMIVSIYGVMNLAYSFGLKHIVILDVFVIAMGFMLRILAGTIGIGIGPSKWLIVCSLMLTLFLGFAKRRAELVQTGRNHQRKVLEHYSVELLDRFISIMASATIITYSLYTMAPETVAQHHTDKLIFTSPIVIYGMFRYLFLVYRRKQGEDPAIDVFRDRQVLFTVLTWGVMTTAILL